MTAAGLKSDSGLKAYAAATTGGDGDDLLQARSHDARLFGNAGNDTLIGHAGGNLTFVGGSGDDILKGVGNGNTFLFSGDFGRDQLYGFNATDKLVFIGTEGASGNIRDYATQQNDDLVLAFGHSGHADRRFARSLQHRSGGVGLRRRKKPGAFAARLSSFAPP